MIQMPDKASEVGFDIDPANVLARQGSGAVGGLSNGWPIWRMEAYLSQQTQIANSDNWTAFIDSLNGSLNQFLATDLTRPLPLLYMASGLPSGFDGTPTSWTQALDDDGNPIITLTDTSMPDGFTLSPRDYIGLKWVNGDSLERRSLHRVCATAVAASRAIAARIEPAVPTFVPEGAQANLVAPDCVMRQETRETKVGRRDVFGRAEITFVAYQDLRP